MLSELILRKPKVDLTKNIPHILNDLQNEVGYAVGKNIGDLQGVDWVSIWGLN